MANFAVSVLFKAIDGISESFEKWSEKGEKFEHEQKKHFEGAQHAAQNFVSVFAAGAALKGVEMLGEGIKKATELLPEFAEKGEAIVLTSAKLGLTTDAFQRLGYAAHMVAIPAETLEKSFAKLNLGMGQLTENQGALDSGLRRIDPALRQQLKTAGSTQEAFLRIADAIQKTSDPAKRAAIAVAAFGKSGQDMIPFLMQGREEITKTMTEADKFGSVLGEDVLGNSDKFSESLKKMKGALGGLKDQVLGGLLEQITPIVGKMAEWVGQNRAMISQGISKTFEVISNVLAKIGPPLERAASALLPAIGSALEKLAPLFQTVFETAADLIEGLAPALDTLTGVFASFAPVIEMAAAMIKMLAPALGLLKPLIEALGYAMQVNMMIWSQSIGRVLELIIRGVAAVGSALGQNMSGATAAADALVKMRDSSTAAVFRNTANDREGPKGKVMDAPNSAGLRASNSQFSGRLDIAGAPPGSKLTTQRGAPGFSTHMADAQGQN